MRLKPGVSALTILALLAMIFCIPGCWLGGTRGDDPIPIPESQITAALTELMPDGRIFSNNLSANKPQVMRGVHLFDNEILVEDIFGSWTSLDRVTLDPKWHFQVGGPSEYAPVVSPVSVLVLRDNMLYEIDRFYGNQRGVISLDFIPSAAPAAIDSTAYFPALAAAGGNRTMISVNLASGIEGWGIATRGSISTPPVIGGSATRPTVYFVTEAAGVFALPAATATSGTPEASWTHGADGRIVCAPTLERNLLLVGSEKGELWALDPVTGVTAWVHYGGEPIRDSAWSSGDQAYFINRKGFHALDRENGQELWSVAELAISDTEVVSRPLRFLVRREDAVYVTDGTGRVFALDPANGELLRWKQFDRSVKFVTNMASHVLYLMTPTGFLFCVDKGID